MKRKHDQVGAREERGTISLACFCGRPEYGDMYQCPRCETWYHNSCTNMTSEKLNLYEERSCLPPCFKCKIPEDMSEFPKDSDGDDDDELLEAISLPEVKKSIEKCAKKRRTESTPSAEEESAPSAPPRLPSLVPQQSSGVARNLPDSASTASPRSVSSVPSSPAKDPSWDNTPLAHTIPTSCIPIQTPFKPDLDKDTFLSSPFTNGHKRNGKQWDTSDFNPPDASLIPPLNKTLQPPAKDRKLSNRRKTASSNLFQTSERYQKNPKGDLLKFPNPASQGLADLRKLTNSQEKQLKIPPFSGSVLPSMNHISEATLGLPTLVPHPSSSVDTNLPDSASTISPRSLSSLSPSPAKDPAWESTPQAPTLSTPMVSVLPPCKPANDKDKLLSSPFTNGHIRNGKKWGTNNFSHLDASLFSPQHLGLRSPSKERTPTHRRTSVSSNLFASSGRFKEKQIDLPSLTGSVVPSMNYFSKGEKLSINGRTLATPHIMNGAANHSSSLPGLPPPYCTTPPFPSSEKSKRMQRRQLHRSKAGNEREIPPSLLRQPPKPPPLPIDVRSLRSLVERFRATNEVLKSEIAELRKDNVSICLNYNALREELGRTKKENVSLRFEIQNAELPKTDNEQRGLLVQSITQELLLYANEGKISQEEFRASLNRCLHT